VIGTNKSDAAQTVRCLLADLAGGPGADDVQLPRPGLLRMPETGAPSGLSSVVEAHEESPVPLSSRFAALLAERGVRPVGYDDWLKIESAERELAASLGRGARVKLASRAELERACGLKPIG
jgi:ferredoxin--NADP+ reductase